MNEQAADKSRSRRNRDRGSQAREPAWFAFYWRDWLSSPSVRLMTKEQRGGYIDYLSHTQGQDTPGVQPKDEVRALAGFTEREWKRHEAAFKRCFRVRCDGMWVQERVVRERAAQKRRFKRAVTAGKKSGRIRKERSDMTRVVRPQVRTQDEPIHSHSHKKLNTMAVPDISSGAQNGSATPGTAGSTPISELLDSVLARAGVARVEAS